MKTERIRTKFFKDAALATLEIQTLLETVSVLKKRNYNSNMTQIHYIQALQRPL